MTAYWPTTAVMQALTQEQRTEIINSRLGIPVRTMHECYRVTSTIPADVTLALVCSKNAGVRRVYLQYPSYEQWIALERGGFVEVWDEFGFIMDALH